MMRYSFVTAAPNDREKIINEKIEKYISYIHSFINNKISEDIFVKNLSLCTLIFTKYGNDNTLTSIINDNQFVLPESSSEFKVKLLEEIKSILEIAGWNVEVLVSGVKVKIDKAVNSLTPYSKIRFSISLPTNDE